MQSNEIRQKFLEFFESKNHKIIPSASLIPENDPSVLFNTAGMQPLVPYLLGQKHPMGTRLADVQKCVRTGDIDEVGDNRHLTFFEMLGNWSLGDYFKEEAIAWSFEFLTSKEVGLELDINRLYVTVFEGNEDAPRDQEAEKIWQKYLPKERIYFMPAKNNWWSAGENGPCGPDTEIFYDPNDTPIGNLSHDEFVRADDEGRVIEIWNNVFMQYEKAGGKVVGKLTQHNVDTGMGLERITMVKQGVKTVFDTDLFVPIIYKIEELSNLKYGDKTDEEYIKNGEQCWVDTRKRMRIISDHVRTAVFMISDGVVPANQGAGSVLKNLIKRAIKNIIILNMESHSLCDLSYIVVDKYKQAYKALENFSGDSFSLLIKEIEQFNETESKNNKLLEKFEKYLKGQGKNPITLRDYIPGKLLEKADNPLITGKEAYILNTTFGISKEDILFFAKNKGYILDLEEFEKELENHKNLSRTASAGMFKGGLANHSEKTVRLHTAHHLLLASLQNVIDKNIKQRGSNITEERLRMDFMFDRKLTDEEKKKVEDWVNDKIQRGLNVVRREMPLSEAEKIGAEMEFGAKYPEIVSVYFVESEDGEVISKEFCGGPHVTNTKELGVFKIQKEEASSAGVRRIKAVLE